MVPPNIQGTVKSVVPDGKYSITQTLAVLALSDGSEYELKLAQIRDLSKCIDLEVVVYGRLPLMVTENCLIRNALGCKSRAIEFSTLQRCASHLASRTDIDEAYRVGAAAVQAAHAGESGRMVTLRRLGDVPYQCVSGTADIDQVANLEKTVPADWIAPDGTHVNERFAQYARPLIQGELSPIFVNGTPRHIRL